MQLLKTIVLHHFKRPGSKLVQAFTLILVRNDFLYSYTHETRVKTFFVSKDSTKIRETSAMHVYAPRQRMRACNNNNMCMGLHMLM